MTMHSHPSYPSHNQHPHPAQAPGPRRGPIISRCTCAAPSCAESRMAMGSSHTVPPGHDEPADHATAPHPLAARGVAFGLVLSSLIWTLGLAVVLYLRG